MKRGSRQRGYTLVEILVATTLTLILMFAVVQIFAMIGDSVSDSRALLETNDRLRAAKTRLQMDLGGLTVVPLPPRGEEGDGYLEIIEGPVMESASVGDRPRDRGLVDGVAGDTTVADFDDILMFTTRDTRTPFVRGDGTTTDVAEVAWFVHGNRLYRRVQPLPANVNLARLVRRENRTRLATRGAAPFRVTPPRSDARDFWTNDANSVGAGTFVVDPDDVILTNVIGFDVKVFDPRAGDYVDLGYLGETYSATGGNTSHFSHVGNPSSGLHAQAAHPHRIYDTWTKSYVIDPSDPESGSLPPPYASALRGIQVKIRVFEPDSRHIREVTVIQDFVPR